MIARVLLGHRRLGRRGIHAAVVLEDLDRDRDAARLLHRLVGRDERHRRDDHLVARPEAEPEEGEAESVETVGDADAPLSARVGRERLLELAHGAAVDEGSRVDERRLIGEDALAHLLVHRPQVDERHCRQLRALRKVSGHVRTVSRTVAMGGQEAHVLLGRLRHGRRPRADA